MDRQTKHVEDLSSQIVQWEAEIARLEDKAERAPEDSKRSYRASIAELQHKRKDAQAKLQRIGTEDAPPLEEVEKGVAGIVEDVRHDLRKAVLKVK